MFASKFVLLVDLYQCLVCDERRLRSANYVIDSFPFVSIEQAKLFFFMSNNHFDGFA